MKYEQSVKDIYKIAGMLEMLTCMQDRPITPGMVAELEDAVDKLELIGAEMMNNHLTPEPRFQNLIDLLGDIKPEKVVNAHEGQEESPPEPQPSDQ